MGTSSSAVWLLPLLALLAMVTTVAMRSLQSVLDRGSRAHGTLATISSLDELEEQNRTEHPSLHRAFEKEKGTFLSALAGREIVFT